MRSLQQVGMENPVIATTGRMPIQYEPYASSSSSVERIWTRIAATEIPEKALTKTMPGNTPPSFELL